MTTLRSWYLAGRRTFVPRLAAIGTAAGLVSWLLALALYRYFGAVRPGVRELLLGLSLGALVGGTLGLALVAYWNRTAGRGTDGR